MIAKLTIAPSQPYHVAEHAMRESVAPEGFAQQGLLLTYK